MHAPNGKSRRTVLNLPPRAELSAAAKSPKDVQPCQSTNRRATERNVLCSIAAVPDLLVRRGFFMDDNPAELSLSNFLASEGRDPTQAPPSFTRWMQAGA